MGEWDKVAINYGYREFAAGTDEPKALTAILDEAWKRDIRYMTNQDLGISPRVDQWSNGTNPAAELTRMLGVRRASLERFGEAAIRRGQPMALIEEVLVPLYLHHRYQVDAASNAVGGLLYTYAMRGDGREAVRRVPAAEQLAALDALMVALRPSELALPTSVLTSIPPRPPGYGMHRELFPRNTGQGFDAITPAVVAADLVVSNLLQPARAARLVAQRAFDSSQPGLSEVIDKLIVSTFQATTATPYEAEIARATQHVLVEGLMSLAESARMPQVRAIARQALKRIMGGPTPGPRAGTVEATYRGYLSDEIKTFLDRPMPVLTRAAAPEAPPGAPIGEPAMDWLKRFERFCSFEQN
jgi:hypothetical protein